MELAIEHVISAIQNKEIEDRGFNVNFFNDISKASKLLAKIMPKEQSILTCFEVYSTEFYLIKLNIL